MTSIYTESSTLLAQARTVDRGCGHVVKGLENLRLRLTTPQLGNSEARGPLPETGCDTSIVESMADATSLE